MWAILFSEKILAIRYNFIINIMKMMKLNLTLVISLINGLINMVTFIKRSFKTLNLKENMY